MLYTSQRSLSAVFFIFCSIGYNQRISIAQESVDQSPDIDTASAAETSQTTESSTTAEEVEAAASAVESVSDAQPEASALSVNEAEEDVAPLEAPPGPEEIVVTGSRIPRVLEKEATVLNLSRMQIDQTGLTSIGDILQQLPMSGGALNTKFNSSGNFGFPPDGGGIGAGATLADLRYLGPKRVLVLVDGVRWVNGSSASGVSSATDLNTIPASIIERVEVLQDGGSAIYGSDAVAGVINIITKKDIDGVQANAYLGTYTEGDGVTQNYDVSWGATNDRSSVYINASYMRQGEVRATEREIAGFPVPGFDTCLAGGCSSGTPQGTYLFTDPNTGQELGLSLNSGVTGLPNYNPAIDRANPGDLSDDYNTFGDEDRFNFAPFNYVLTPSERVGVFGQASYNLTDDITLFTRTLYNNRRSVNQAAPEPLFFGPDGSAGARMENISIDVTNPYNPFGFTIEPSNNPGYFIGRRPVEAGPRIFEQNVDTWYIAGGAKGSFDISDMNFFWDVTALYSRNRADQLKSGAFNGQRLEVALGPVDVCENTNGCVPFNLFGGPGTITPEMLDYVTFVQKDVSEQQLWDISANLAGQLFELWGGPLSVAVGVEHRDQFGFFQPDAVVVAGDSAGVPSTPTRGGFNVTEGYAEIVAPVLGGLPGADLLEFSGAVRVSDYSTFGSNSTFQAGLRYRPFSGILLRGSYAQGFRAPGIGELFGSEARFDQTLLDPCSDFDAIPQALRDNCVALGVPDDGSYSQVNPQIGVTTGGNRDLDPETSETFTFAATISPDFINQMDWVQQLSLEFFYYNISVNDAIRAPNAGDILDGCLATLDPVLCGGIERISSGAINRFANRLTNIGEIFTDGFDITLNYASPKTALGRFGLYMPISILNSFNVTVPTATGFTTFRRAGTEIGDPEQAFPELKATLTLSWVNGPWSASVTNRYIHSVEEPCLGFDEEEYRNAACSDPRIIIVDNPNTVEVEEDEVDVSTNVLDAVLYTDMQVTFSRPIGDRQTNITVGVNNLLNVDPPECYSCALNGFDGTTYNIPGVFGYVRAGISL